MVYRKIILGMALFGSAVSVLAQGGTCAALVQEALEAAEAVCLPTARNEACYGNVQIEADLAEGMTFAQQGDIVPLASIERLSLAGLNEAEGTWGVALLRLQADLPDTMPGQNVTFLLFGESEIENLAGTNAPMQAVYFTSGIGSTDCADAPDGLLVQTPEGVEEVSFNINGAEVTLGSTAFFQTRLNDADRPPSLTMSVLEGQGTITAFGVTQPVFAGSWVRVPIDADFNVADAPLDPKPYQFETFEVLPIGILGRDFTIVPSLTQAQIDTKLADQIIMPPAPRVTHTFVNATPDPVTVAVPGQTPMIIPAETQAAVEVHEGVYRVEVCAANCVTAVVEVAVPTADAPADPVPVDAPPADAAPVETIITPDWFEEPVGNP